MKIRIREGNDFDVAWAIKRAGQPEDLSTATSMKLTLVVYGLVIEHELFTVTDNVLSINIPKEVATIKGDYRLVFEYTLPDAGQPDGDLKCKTDVVPFRIVPFTADADDIYTVNVTSDIAFGFKGDKGDDGDDAYQIWLDLGNDGTYEDFIAYMRQPAVDAGASISELEGEIQVSEGLRVQAETARVNAEGDETKGRVKAENERVAAEIIRQSNEGNRIENEATRVQNEAERISEEDIRQSNEINRVENEATRVQDEAERISEEDIRQSNEINRVENEATRVQDEAERISKENVRQNSEVDRIEAEGVREQAESERVVAETARVNAEGDETKGRVKAENERVQAESEREQAFTQMMGEADDKIEEMDTTLSTYDGRVTQVEADIDQLAGDLDEKADKSELILFAKGTQTKNIINKGVAIQGQIASTGTLNKSIATSSVIQMQVDDLTGKTIFIQGGASGLARATFYNSSDVKIGTSAYSFGKTSPIVVPDGAYTLYFQYTYNNSAVNTQTMIEVAESGQTTASEYIAPIIYPFATEDELKAVDNKIQYTTSPNLIDETKRVKGYRLDSGGSSIVADANYDLFVGIAVTNSICIYNVLKYSEYDANGAVLYGISTTGGDTLFALNANTTSVTLQVNAGQEFVFIAQSEERVKYSEKTFKNALSRFDGLIEIFPTIINGISYKDNVSASHPSSSSTEFVKVSEGDRMLFLFSSYSLFGEVGLFDEDKNWIKSIGKGAINTRTYNDGFPYVVESGVGFIMVSTREETDYVPRVWTSAGASSTSKSIIYPKMLVYRESATLIYLYVRQHDNIYLRYEFNIQTDIRINKVYRAELNSYNAESNFAQFVIQDEYVTDGKWEIAVSMSSDFIGHGNTNPFLYYTMLANGVDITSYTIGSYYEVRHAEFSYGATGLDINQGNIEVFRDYIRVVLTENSEVTIDTKLVGTVDTALTSNAFLGMCSALRTSDRGAGTTQITHTYSNNIDWQKIDMTNGNQASQPDITETTKGILFGDNFSVEAEILYRNKELPTRSMYCTNSQLYNKLYCSFGSTGETLHAGEVWHQITRFKLSCN